MWLTSFINELGLLAQGLDNNQNGTNTIKFVPYNRISTERRGQVTYGRIVVDNRQHKTEEHRIRLSVGGDHIKFPVIVITLMADLHTVKMLVNHVISKPGVQFATVYIRNFIWEHQ